MIIPLKEILEIAPNINGVCHIGSHRGEELPHYLQAGISNLCFIEANPQLAVETSVNIGPNYKCLQALISNTTGEEVDFNLLYSIDGTNMGCSSLMQPSKEFLKMYPCIKKVGSVKLKTITLDDLYIKYNIPFNKYNFINMDIQGAELKALQGATQILPHIQVILTEFSVVQLYENQCVLSNLDEFLSKKGFCRVLTKFVEDERAQNTWGDCVFLRN